MLAEPRKRNKWSSDPQNTTWARDESRFGVKMLQRMGWEKGKGLGANQNGKVDPVKVLHKVDNLGLGCRVAHDNNWVANQDDFSSLLSELNNNVTESKDKKDISEDTVANLEEKSKIQRRVHYKKFTRGKDLSNYKATDMAAIFGSKVCYSEPVTPQNMSEVEECSSSIESCPEVSDLKKEKRKSKKKRKQSKTKLAETYVESVNIVKSQYNVHEYFKMRMEKLSAAKKNSSLVSVDEDKRIEQPIQNKQVTVKKKQKKKKRDSCLNNATTCSQTLAMNSKNVMISTTTDNGDADLPPKSKKRKKEILKRTNKNACKGNETLVDVKA